uniref:Peptidase aspartic putative domain-containing protein n=1 Tax=Glossina palpalis gambiensis TaxID=67801 RepID=A0A1B0BV04_9MUSC
MRNTVTKLHHLISKLSPAAKAPLAGVKIIAENYEIIRQRLKDRFENKKIIGKQHIKQIFEHPKIVHANAADLRVLIDNLNNHLIGLKNINRPVESWDDLMVYIIKSKLDPATLNKWNEEAPIDRLAALSELLNFLKRIYQILEGNLSYVSLNSGASTSRAIEPKRVQRTAKSFATIKNCCSFRLKPKNANHNMSDQAQPKNFAALKTQHTERNILATAIVYIISKYYQHFPCRVLLDGGPQINMISERMVHMTGLKRQYAPIQFQCANKTRLVSYLLGVASFVFLSQLASPAENRSSLPIKSLEYVVWLIRKDRKHTTLGLKLQIFDKYLVEETLVKQDSQLGEES